MRKAARNAVCDSMCVVLPFTHKRLTKLVEQRNNAKEKKEPTDDTSIDVYSQQVNSTSFGHHYSHLQENRLYKTACGVSLDVLAAVVWSRDTS